MNIAGPLLFALLAAVGNALFALGQRKAAPVENSFVFIILTLLACLLFCTLSAPLSGPVNYTAMVKTSALWALFSGFGLYLTYIGFNMMYANYGASSYLLYAVLSIITTTVIVGALLLRENLNVYHWLAVITALATVVLFSWGNKVGQ